VFAVFLLLLPAVATVWAANTFAGLIDPAIQSLAGPLAEWFGQLPSPAGEVLAGRYRLMMMGPLLFVWAGPTVVLYTLFLSIYKASGLIDLITTVTRWCAPSACMAAICTYCYEIRVQCAHRDQHAGLLRSRKPSVSRVS